MIESMEGKRVYLGGPMRGYPMFNFPAFHAVALDLRMRGAIVYDPAEEDEAEGFNPAQDDPDDMRVYMMRDLPALLCSELMVLLPGWEHSRGCSMETWVAAGCGIPMRTYSGWMPVSGDSWLLARRAVSCIMEARQAGAARHPGESGRTEDWINHYAAAAGHAAEAIRQSELRGGHAQDDEDHLGRAICRLTMARELGKYMDEVSK